jgi:hypothetical protein
MSGLRQHTDNDDTKIKGGTDGTEIGNIGDRLKTDASISAEPASSIVYAEVNVDNAGSEDMNVNGSVTPVVFTAGPGAGEKWYIFELGVTIEDSGNNTVERYGSISGVTNGTLVEQVISGTAYTFTNVLNNLNIVETFTDHSFRGVSNSYLNSPNFFTGKAELRVAVTLDGDNSDVIRVTVRDNLTGLDQHRFSVEYYRVLP